jgi:hypothetical protein
MMAKKVSKETMETHEKDSPKTKSGICLPRRLKFFTIRTYNVLLTEKENTSTTSRATRQAVSLAEERSGVAADKQEPASDPTILLYLLISFNLQSKSSQYSKLIKSS